MTEPVQPLDYGAINKRRHRFLKLFGLLLAIGVAVITCWFFSNRIAIQIHQHRLTKMASSGNGIAWQGDFIAAEPSQIYPNVSAFTARSASASKFIQQCLHVKYNLSLGESLFFQYMTAKGKPERLVMLWGNEIDPNYTYGRQPRSAPVEISVNVFEPATLFNEARPIGAIISTPTTAAVIKQGYTLYDGQVDVNDPSHMTIRGLFDGREIIFDGWLRSDDSFVLQPRSAVTPPPPSSAATLP